MGWNQGTLERRKDKVFELIYAGLNDTECARLLTRGRGKASPQAVSEFRKRHAAEIEAHKLEKVKAVEDFDIASQFKRTMVRDMIHTKLLEVIREREQGKHGTSTGLVVKTKKAVGTGKNQEIIDEYRLDPSVIQMIDLLERSTAEELGQLIQPEKGKGDNINNGVIIYQVEGYTGPWG